LGSTRSHRGAPWRTLGVIANLAVQIRRNTAVVRTASFQELMEGTSRFTTTISQNAEAAEIYERGIVGHEGLSETEKTRFNALMAELFSVAQLAYQLEKRGLIDAELYAGFVASFNPMLEAPGVRQWWRTGKKWWHQDFRDFIDEKVNASAAHRNGARSS